MAKYIFENNNKAQFKNCSAEEMQLIAGAIKNGRCELWVSLNNKWMGKGSQTIHLDSSYRVLAPAPTPNVVDWSQVPKEFKYCFSYDSSGGVFSERIPIELETSRGEFFLNIPNIGIRMRVNNQTKGFKRGTVESIDSLLVRPIGE